MKMDDEQDFEEINHTADRGFHVRGRDLSELFQRSAGALFALGGPCVEASTTCEHNIELAAFDRETLLVNWLNELLYLQEIHNECYRCVEIRNISDTAVSAIVRGSPAAEARRIIRAVTFHNLRITEIDEGLETTIVVDV